MRVSRQTRGSVTKWQIDPVFPAFANAVIVSRRARPFAFGWRIPAGYAEKIQARVPPLILGILEPFFTDKGQVQTRHGVGPPDFRDIQGHARIRLKNPLSR